MKTNEKKNTSAKKKLIPAVAMLTTSAVMLSTATYAWFTLSKTAEVTGINLAATAGGSLEISLGQLTAPNTPNTAETTPTADNISWTNVVDLSEYYSKIGKLKPASSIDANNLFYADNSGVYAGGMFVKDGTKINVASDEATMTYRVASDTAATEVGVDTTNGTDGYYIDIPMWIRSTQKSEQTVSCDVTIKNKSGDEAKNLQNAVRVAFIPLNKASEANTNTSPLDALKIKKITANALSTAYKVLDSKSPLSVFGTNFDTYNSKAIKEAVATPAEADTYTSHLDTVTYTPNKAKSSIDDNYDPESSTTKKAVFDLAAATDNNYSVEGFVVRVWLEGESKYCNDATANQDWTIQLDFTGAEKTE